jgi:hypothetical protein
VHATKKTSCIIFSQFLIWHSPGLIQFLVFMPRICSGFLLTMTIYVSHLYIYHPNFKGLAQVVRVLVTSIRYKVWISLSANNFSEPCMPTKLESYLIRIEKALCTTWLDTRNGHDLKEFSIILLKTVVKRSWSTHQVNI